MAPSRLPKKRNWGRPLGPPIKDPIRIRGSGVRSPGGDTPGCCLSGGHPAIGPLNRRVLFQVSILCATVTFRIPVSRFSTRVD
jgi:hypothetical protein